MKRFGDEKGQILLVVVLTMIVALTVGLSVVSRTITNLKISKQSEESQRAFQAAEAGIEKTLKSGSGGEQQLSNNANFTTSVLNTQGTEFLLNGGEIVEQDAGMDLWLSNYPDFSGQICNTQCQVTILFNTGTQCSAVDKNKTSAALEVVVLSGSVSVPIMNKYLFDPCGGRTSGASNAPEVSGGSAIIGTTTFQHGATIPVTNGIIARVIPIYNSVQAGVRSTVNMPLQGRLIESTGSSGETVRKVQYFSSHPQLPLEIFPYSVIAQELK